MPSPTHDSQHIRTELTLLLNHQMDILEKETFGGLTEVDILEYADRHERIRELYAELIDQEAAA